MSDLKCTRSLDHVLITSHLDTIFTSVRSALNTAFNVLTARFAGQLAVDVSAQTEVVMSISVTSHDDQRGEMSLLIRGLCRTAAIIVVTRSRR